MRRGEVPLDLSGSLNSYPYPRIEVEVECPWI
ncbi:hypothetical protein Y695_00249 [Hydrogenophaga sp. T4]|nr:hypothetical protein Y695_00249 [Hydrogenophaga sp. T4]